MKLKMYSLKDEYNGFAPPIPFANEEIAKRWFKEMKAENLTVKNSPGDFSVWEVGTFDGDTGKFESIEPKLIERG